MSGYLTVYDPNYLSHHGIKGMRWGVRRYQNEDGSLTSAGKKRYGEGTIKTAKQYERRINDLGKVAGSSALQATNLRATAKHYDKKAKIASAKGQTEKAAKFNSRAQDAAKMYSKEMNNYVSIGQKYMKALDELDNSGYSWKTKSYPSMAANYRTQAGKEYIKKHGLFSMIYEANYTIPNKIKVSDNLSERKKDIWKAKQDRRMIKEIGYMTTVYT